MGTTASPLELKRLVIATLDLEDLTPEDLDDNEPLFGGRLGLDSVDALELGLALQRVYGVQVERAGSFRERLGTIAALAKWIAAQ